MKLNILLPWICVLGLSVALASVFVSSKAKETELAQLRADVEQSKQRLAEMDDLQTRNKQQTDQIVELKKDNQELLRLRGEVGKLKSDNQQLSKQLQGAQTQAQLAQTHAEQAMKTAAERGTQLANIQATDQRAAVDAIRFRNMCITNLRMLDAAKQQWALEYNRPAEAQPTVQEVVAYLPGNVLPTCPAGGAYTINVVSNVPTCTIPGHALQ